MREKIYVYIKDARKKLIYYETLWDAYNFTYPTMYLQITTNNFPKIVGGYYTTCNKKDVLRAFLIKKV